MRKLIATVFNYSLDGLLADEGTEFWKFCFDLPENREPDDPAQLDFLQSAYAHIMGRTAYEGIAGSMTTSTDHPFADILNAARKVVFSRTLKTADWANTTIAAGDTTEEIDQLRLGGDYQRHTLRYLQHYLPTTQPGTSAFDSDKGKASVGLWLLVLFVLEWGWNVLFETFWRGQTPGKRMLRLRVVRDGYPVGFIDSVLRNLLRAADFLPVGYVLGLLAMAGDARFRRLVRHGCALRRNGLDVLEALQVNDRQGVTTGIRYKGIGKRGRRSQVHLWPAAELDQNQSAKKERPQSPR
jgi:hypothetical protein